LRVGVFTLGAVGEYLDAVGLSLERGTRNLSATFRRALGRCWVSLSVRLSSEAPLDSAEDPSAEGRRLSGGGAGVVGVPSES